MLDVQVCSSSECVITAGMMLSKMNASVDPCNDFYEYSCAAFVSNVNIPPDKTYYTTLGGDMESRKKPRIRRVCKICLPLKNARIFLLLVGVCSAELTITCRNVMKSVSVCRNV
jgi:hypothetical protein